MTKGIIPQKPMLDAGKASALPCMTDSCPLPIPCGTLHQPVGKTSQNSQRGPPATICHGRHSPGGKPVHGKQAHETPELQLPHQLLQGPCKVKEDQIQTDTFRPFFILKIHQLQRLQSRRTFSAHSKGSIPVSYGMKNMRMAMV